MDKLPLQKDNEADILRVSDSKASQQIIPQTLVVNENARQGLCFIRNWTQTAVICIAYRRISITDLMFRMPWYNNKLN